MATPPKLFLMVILESIVFFSKKKKLINEKYSEPRFLQKRLYRFLSPMTASIVKIIAISDAFAETM